MTWTKEDSAAAREQGWDVFDCYEDGKFEKVIQCHGDVMRTDESARLFVQHRAKNNDQLCLKALREVFQSKMPNFEEVVKKTKQRRKA